MRTLAIASGKGGVGVTTLAIALGASLTELGVDTTLIDANLSTPNVGIHLGTPNAPVTLHDALAHPQRLSQALYHHAPSGLKVIPGGVSVTHARMKHHELLKLPSLLANHPGNLAILDCASGLHPEALAAVAMADEVIVVTTPELPAVIDTFKLVTKCREFGTPVRGAVVNRAGQHSAELPVGNIQALLETPVIGVIPNDVSASHALAIKHPLTYSHPDSPAAKAVKLLAQTLIS